MSGSALLDAAAPLLASAFVLWGALHGTYLIINHAWLHVIEGKAWAQTAAMRFGGRAVTLLAVIVGWVFFRAKTAPQALALLGGMAGAHGAALPLQLHPLLAKFAAPLHLGFATAPFKVQDLWIVVVAGLTGGDGNEDSLSR